jgi:hypothetical protein
MDLRNGLSCFGRMDGSILYLHLLMFKGCSPLLYSLTGRITLSSKDLAILICYRLNYWTHVRLLLLSYCRFCSCRFDTIGLRFWESWCVSEVLVYSLLQIQSRNYLCRNILTFSGKNYGAIDAVKGDLFVILGACCYGVSNVLEEFLVSKRPLYEVVGQVLSLSKCAKDSSGSLECSSWGFNALFLNENLSPTQLGAVLLLDIL